jgi:cell division protein FtsA
VRKKLGTAFSPEKCTAGVVLTGGTSKLPDIADRAAKVFGIPAHLGEPPATVRENLRDPGYNTALGLLYYGLASHAEASSASGCRNPGFFKKLFSGF